MAVYGSFRVVVQQPAVRLIHAAPRNTGSTRLDIASAMCQHLRAMGMLLKQPFYGVDGNLLVEDLAVWLRDRREDPERDVEADVLGRAVCRTSCGPIRSWRVSGRSASIGASTAPSWRRSVGGRLRERQRRRRLRAALPRPGNGMFPASRMSVRR